LALSRKKPDRVKTTKTPLPKDQTANKKHLEHISEFYFNYPTILHENITILGQKLQESTKESM
jgi:hypothetical protein